QAGVQARGELAVTVVEHGTATDGTGARVDLVVDEVHLAQVRVAFLVGQAQIHRGGLAALTVAGQLRVLEVDAFVGVEVGVDLVGRNHAGQRRDIGSDDVAGSELGAADATADRCGDAGEAQVQAGQVQLCLDRGDAGAGFGG